MEYNSKIFIVLLNYNGYQDTIDCMESLKNTEYKNLHIIIVDNNSTDGSEEHIKKYIVGKCEYHFIQSGVNLGFSAGNNIGIEYAISKGADYICLLNNDTIVEKDFLNPLVKEMDSNKDIGIASGKILYHDCPNVIWYGGGYISHLRALGVHEGINEIDSHIYNNKKEVCFLTGCFQLIRRQVFEDVGFYDEDYFLYMEDVDFCVRVKQANYKLLYVPESKIYHKVSSSTGGVLSPTTIYYMSRNRLLFNSKFNKNIICSIIFKCFYFVRLALELFRKGKKFKYSLQGVIDYFNKNFGPKILK